MYSFILDPKKLNCVLPPTTSECVYRRTLVFRKAVPGNKAILGTQRGDI